MLNNKSCDKVADWQFSYYFNGENLPLNKFLWLTWFRCEKILLGPISILTEMKTARQYFNLFEAFLKSLNGILVQGTIIPLWCLCSTPNMPNTKNKPLKLSNIFSTVGETKHKSIILCGYCCPRVTCAYIILEQPSCNFHIFRVFFFNVLWQFVWFILTLF